MKVTKTFFSALMICATLVFSIQAANTDWVTIKSLYPFKSNPSQGISNCGVNVMLVGSTTWSYGIVGTGISLGDEGKMLYATLLSAQNTTTQVKLILAADDATIIGIIVGKTD